MHSVQPFKVVAMLKQRSVSSECSYIIYVHQHKAILHYPAVEHEVSYLRQTYHLRLCSGRLGIRYAKLGWMWTLVRLNLD